MMYARGNSAPLIYGRFGRSLYNEGLSLFFLENSYIVTLKYDVFYDFVLISNTKFFL